MEGNSHWSGFRNLQYSNAVLAFEYSNFAGPILQVQIGHIASIKNSGEEGHSDRQYRWDYTGRIYIVPRFK